MLQEQEKSDEIDHGNGDDGEKMPSLTPDYVSFLENEVRRLKKENQDFAEKIELIKGAATATRRAIPVCACAKQTNNNPRGGGGKGPSVGGVGKDVSPSSFQPNDDVSAQLWSIIQ